MKYTFLVLSFLFLCLSCSNYEKTDLYGHWKNDNWEFIFNEDGTCKVGKNSNFQKGNWTYTTLGNTLEISRDRHVFLSNLTIKEVTKTDLVLEFRNIVNNEKDKTKNHQILKRVK